MERLKNYEVLATLEKTRYAELYKVRTDSSVLLLKIAKERNPELNGLITREFHILSQFNHEHIVKVFDYGISDDDRAYFTSEFVSGAPINKFLKGWSKTFVDTMLQILDALIQFHNSGYVHSDLKPEHILYLPEDKRAVLIDFGFASLLNDWQTPRGTYGYIAPEVLKGSGIGLRSDLYSLGAIMYEILTQKPVNQSKDEGYAMFHIFRDNIGSEVPEEVRDVIFKLLATEPALRPSVGNVYEILNEFSSKKRLNLPDIRISLPQLPFMDVCKITNHLSEVEKLTGKTFVILGDKGIGKTKVLNELHFKYLLSGHNVLSFSKRSSKRFFDEINEYSELKTSSDIEDESTVFEQAIDELNAKQKSTDKLLIIMVDDLDELERFDRSFFRYLGFSIKDSKIVLIATAESSLEIDKMGFENLQLRRFTSLEIREFINKIFNNTINGEFSDWLYEASGGNPLYVEEILKLLVEKNILHYRENIWHLTHDALDGFSHPRKIEGIILAKIKNLDGAGKKILQILALYKNPMEPVVFMHVAGMQSLGRLELLNQSGLVRKAQLNGRLAYVIASDAIRKVVEKSISEKHKPQLYKKFFTFIKKNFSDVKEYIPYIAEYAEVCNDVKTAYFYSLRAAEIKESKYDFEGSINFLKKAINSVKNMEPENLVSLFMKVGTFEKRLGNTDAALNAYLNAFKYARNKSESADLNYSLGQIYQTKAQYDKSVEYFNKALTLIEEKTVNYARILNGLSYSLILSEKFSEVRSLLEESLAIAEETRDNELKIKTLYLFAVFEWFRQNYEEGIKVVKEALKIAQSKNELNLVSKCYNLLASLYQQRGDFENAERAYDYAIQFLQALKNVGSLIEAVTNFALLIKSQSKFDKAIQLLCSALNLARKVGNNRTIARLFINLANIYEIKGDFDKAIKLNRRAIETDNTALKPMYNLSMLYYKKREFETAEKFIKDAPNISDDPLYYLVMALINEYIGKTAEAETNIKRGFEKMAVSKMDFFKKIEFYLNAIEFYYSVSKYEDCAFRASESLKFLSSGTREYIITDAVLKLSNSLITKTETADINSNLGYLKTTNCLYDWACLKRMEIEALYNKNEDAIASKIEELFNAEEIFRNFGAYTELDRVQALKNQILKNTRQLHVKRTISSEYLRVIYNVSEIIRGHLGEEDYVEKILDILVSTTHADRGILFLTDKPRIKLIAGRNMDQETINDARKISKSIIKETGKKGGIICCPDALTDSRFRNSRSVILNQIRSFMCAPLQIGIRTIGVIYLDSTHACSLFSEGDKDFLMTVANLIASTIERSSVFQKMQEERIFLRMGILPEYANEYLFGESSTTKEIRNMINKIAKTDSTVLIKGETGCGKGMVARLIHQGGARKNGNFVQVNCGGVPETLFESELFGYKKGAFTGAHTDKKGLFEEANGGTLFLDEIANTPPAMQGKLLDAIETKKIRRLGETTERKVDVRLIT